MSSKKGISMIALIITIIIIIILAAIVFIASSDTIGSASYATFSQEFSDYALNFQNDALSNVRLKYGTAGKVVTNAQAVYMASKPGNTITDGELIPAGVEFVTALGKLTSKALYDENRTNVTAQYWGAPTSGNENDNNDIACYELADNAIKGYKNPEFYGNNLGQEKHYVTENGFVFTIPGYPREVDGINRMYIATGIYYVAGENYKDIISTNDSKEVAAHVVDGGGSSSGIPEELRITRMKLGDYVEIYDEDGFDAGFGTVSAKEGGNIIVELEDDGGTVTLDANSYVVTWGDGAEGDPWGVVPFVTEAEIMGKVLRVGDYVKAEADGLGFDAEDKWRIISLGGLVSGLTIEDIKLGSSSSRNPNLVNIFHRLNFVEAYGTGIPRMYEEYRTSITNPEIKAAPNSFLVILPKLYLKNEYVLIIDYLKRNVQCTREIFENVLNLGKSATINILNEMLEKDIIEKIGFSKNIAYKLK